jgi:hypothetical protein
MRIIVAAALASLVAVAPHIRPVHAQTARFVAVTGDDQGGANDCSNPLQPCATIQNAVNHTDVGDLINIGPGTFFENVTVFGETFPPNDVTFQGDLTTGSIVNGGGAGPVLAVGGSHTATFKNLTITNGNSGDATGNAGGGISTGGGTTVTVIGCTISGNRATGTESGGGAIFNASGGTLTVINSTISGNSANQAGAIQNNSSATVTLVNTTVAGNTASPGLGGGIANFGTLNYTNTIFAGNTGGDYGGFTNSVIGTNDHNLVQDGSGSPALSGDPKLGPLKNSGGPTFTRALLPGSPAIDAGDDAVLGGPLDLTTDQRGFGFPRKSCAQVDIGAYEAAAGVPPTIKCPANIAATSDPGQATATLSFSATASDPCDGALAPVYKIGSTVIISPHAFPGGTTTVTASATGSGGLTVICSFTVSVTLLDKCIQDDHTGDTLRFNSTTGQYAYTRCADKLTLTGTGVVRNTGGLTSLTDTQVDRRISALYNPGTLTGRANITLVIAPGVYQTIIVNQTNPHPTCACP